MLYGLGEMILATLTFGLLHCLLPLLQIGQKIRFLGNATYSDHRDCKPPTPLEIWFLARPHLQAYSRLNLCFSNFSFC